MGESSNPARSRIRFHDTFRHGLAEGRRSLAQGCLGILDLLLGHSRLNFLDEALEGAQRRMVTGMPLHSLAGSANSRFMDNRHSRLL